MGLNGCCRGEYFIYGRPEIGTPTQTHLFETDGRDKMLMFIVCGAKSKLGAVSTLSNSDEYKRSFQERPNKVELAIAHYSLQIVRLMLKQFCEWKVTSEMSQLILVYYCR